MRFSCDSCHRVYVVSPELSGLAFRMKCKTCGNAIAVRPESSQTSAAPGPATAAVVPRTIPVRSSASAVAVEPDLLAGLVAEVDLGELAAASAASPAPIRPATVPTMAAAPAPLKATQAARAEAVPARAPVNEPPSPRYRRRTLPRRASLVPTFVLSAILALVVAVSIYFGRDPAPDIRRARNEHLAGEPSTPDRDGPVRGRP